MKLLWAKMKAVKWLNKKLLLLAVAMTCIQSVFAHSINYALENAPSHEVVWFYLI